MSINNHKKRTTGKRESNLQKEIARLKKRDKDHLNENARLMYYVARMAQFNCYNTIKPCNIDHLSSMNDWCPSCLAKSLIRGAGITIKEEEEKE